MNARTGRFCQHYRMIILRFNGINIACTISKYNDRDMFTCYLYDLNMYLWKWWMGSAKNAYMFRVVTG